MLKNEKYQSVKVGTGPCSPLLLTTVCTHDFRLPTEQFPTLPQSILMSFGPE